MKLQEFYNNVSHSLRTYGNPYGGQYQRGWNWVNNNNPNERCAIAKFIKGNNDFEVMENLAKYFGVKSKFHVLDENPLIFEIINLFDYYSCEINNKERLEYHLKHWADKYNLQYTPTTDKYEVISELETA